MRSWMIFWSFGEASRPPWPSGKCTHASPRSNCSPRNTLASVVSGGNFVSRSSIRSTTRCSSDVTAGSVMVMARTLPLTHGSRNERTGPRLTPRNHPTTRSRVRWATYIGFRRVSTPSVEGGHEPDELLAVLGGGAGHGAPQPHRPAQGVDLAIALVDDPEVGEDAGYDGRAVDRVQVRGIPRRRRAGHGPVQGAAAVGVELPTAVERVDEHRRVHLVAHQEVARHPHARQGHADAAAHLHAEDGERDGDADAAVEHLVEVGVARVVVVVDVPVVAPTRVEV